MSICEELVAEQKAHYERELSELLDHDGIVMIDNSLHGRFVKSRLEDHPPVYTLPELWRLERQLYETLLKKMSEHEHISVPAQASIEFLRGINNLARTIDDPAAALKERWWTRQRGPRALPMVEDHDSSEASSAELNNALREAKACLGTMRTVYDAFGAFPSEAYRAEEDMQHNQALKAAIADVTHRHGIMRDYSVRHRNGSAHRQHKHHDKKIFRTLVMASYRHPFVTGVSADSDLKRMHQKFYEEIDKLSLDFGFPVPKHRVGMVFDWKSKMEVLE